MDYNPSLVAELAITNLGCRSSNENETMACLMKRDPFDFVLSLQDYTEPFIDEVPWRPTIDGYFLPNATEELLIERLV